MRPPTGTGLSPRVGVLGLALGSALFWGALLHFRLCAWTGSLPRPRPLAIPSPSSNIGRVPLVLPREPVGSVTLLAASGARLDDLLELPVLARQAPRTQRALYSTRAAGPAALVTTLFTGFDLSRLRGEDLQRELEDRAVQASVVRSATWPQRLDEADWTLTRHVSDDYTPLFPSPWRSSPASRASTDPTTDLGSRVRAAMAQRGRPRSLGLIEGQWPPEGPQRQRLDGALAAMIAGLGPTGLLVVIGTRLENTEPPAMAVLFVGWLEGSGRWPVRPLEDLPAQLSFWMGAPRPALTVGMPDLTSVSWPDRPSSTRQQQRALRDRLAAVGLLGGPRAPALTRAHRELVEATGHEAAGRVDQAGALLEASARSALEALPGREPTSIEGPGRSGADALAFARVVTTLVAVAAVWASGRPFAVLFSMALVVLGLALGGLDGLTLEFVPGRSGGDPWTVHEAVGPAVLALIIAPVLFLAGGPVPRAGPLIALAAMLAQAGSLYLASALEYNASRLPDTAILAGGPKVAVGLAAALIETVTLILLVAALTSAAVLVARRSGTHPRSTA